MPGFHRGVQVAVRGRDDPHVDRDRLAAAERPHRALLQHPQQLDLQGGRHVPDFVEQQRAAVGLLEQALVIGDGVGEGALHVAEQFRLEQAPRGWRRS